VRQREKGER
jgi:hypothetical protein